MRALGYDAEAVVRAGARAEPTGRADAAWSAPARAAPRSRPRSWPRAACAWRARGGRWEDTDTFTARPREMTPRLYRDAGQVATLGHPPIVLPLGRAVGGTTLINSGTCFRTPGRVLARWARERRPRGHRADDAVPAASRRRQRRRRGAAETSPGATRRWSGAGWRPWAGRAASSTATCRGCVGSGVCAFGCPPGPSSTSA